VIRIRLNEAIACTGIELTIYTTAQQLLRWATVWP